MPNNENIIILILEFCEQILLSNTQTMNEYFATKTIFSLRGMAQKVERLDFDLNELLVQHLRKLQLTQKCFHQNLLENFYKEILII